MDELEAELRRLGRWSDTPPEPAAFESRRAFFGDTMAFETWLQFVLIPTVRRICAEEGALPSQSDVGAYAVRSFDGDDGAGHLTTLLSEFDRLIAGQPSA